MLFKFVKWRVGIAIIIGGAILLSVLVAVIVINIGEAVAPTVVSRPPDPRGTADFNAWTGEVTLMCKDLDKPMYGETRESIIARWNQLARGRAIVGIEAEYEYSDEYRSYGEDLVTLVVKVGEVKLRSTFAKAARPELAEHVRKYNVDRPAHNCIVVTADVVEPAVAAGGSYPTPCFPYYKVNLREIAHCMD